jgi:hypothetical protein
VHVVRIQPMSTFTHEKIRCQGLNQTKTKTQHWNESKMCDAKQINKWPTTNHSPTPLPKQEWMWILNVKEMESSSKIDLKDVSWWKSIKDTYRLRVSITTRLSKERCISLATRGRPSHIAHKHDWSKCALAPPPRNIFFQKQIYWKY